MKAFEAKYDLGALLTAHKYEQYLKRYDEVADEIPERDAHFYLFDAMYALMALRRYEQSLDVAMEYHRTSDSTPKFARDLGRGLTEMGACQWMLGRINEAISTWQDLCHGIQDGKYQYAKDITGGIHAGLLLWFGAASSRDDVAMLKATRYLENRLKRIAKLSSTTVWPVPAARFALGTEDASQMIDAALRSPAFRGGLRDISPSEPIGRRNLSVAYLIAGARERSQGRESSAAEFFCVARALENPISEVAWYLARHESETAKSREGGG